MRGLVVSLAIVLSLCSLSAPASAAEPRGAHRFSFVSIEGAPLPLAGFAGKAVLVVNTASFCGYTPQYRGLQALWQRYRARGLVVLGVPSNDFGAQEPGSAEQIKQFCEVNYDIDFPLAEKTVVRGAKAHPFYLWAAETLGADAAPRWNFHKYLVAPDGRLVAWFPTATEPDDPGVIEAIEAQLPAQGPAS